MDGTSAIASSALFSTRLQKRFPPLTCAGSAPRLNQERWRAILQISIGQPSMISVGNGVASTSAAFPARSCGGCSRNISRPFPGTACPETPWVSMPAVEAGLAACVRTLKRGAPMLLYIYYAFDNRPTWFRLLWRVSDGLRRLLSRAPFRLKSVVAELLAACVYWPLARGAKVSERLGGNIAN